MRILPSRPIAKIVIATAAGVAAVLAVLAAAGAEPATVSPPVSRPAAGQVDSQVVGDRAVLPVASGREAIRAASGRRGPVPRNAHRQRVDHSNVGATHSPQLLHQFGGMAAPPPGLAHALRGVDVAAYQHPDGRRIDWRRVAKAGIQFAAIKATEGTYYKNPFALADLAQARAAGLSVMAYVFAVPNGNGGASSPVAQADYLVNYLASSGSPLPPIMLDIEYNPYGAECYGLSRAAMVSWIARFSAEVAARTGEDPIVYGPVPWWQECTGGSSQFGQFPLWVPDYTMAGGPELTRGWANWSFWQYSSAGAVAGIDARGDTDLDLLNPGVIPLLDSGSQAGTAGEAVDLKVRSADPVSGQALSFSAKRLPAGVTINAAGRITGWPGVAGTYQARVRAVGGNGRSGSISFPWTVRPAPGVAPSGATSGMVRVGRGGMCLTAAAGGPADGAQVSVARCAGSSAQTWAYPQDSTLQIGSQCLTVPEAARGAPAVLEPCDGAAAQQWDLADPRANPPALGAPYPALVNPWSGMCLAGRAGGKAGNTGAGNAGAGRPGAAGAAGAGVVLWACDGNRDESWTLPAGPMASEIPGLCLDDRGDQTANGTEIDLWSCNGTAAQAWLAEPDGTVRVNGRCLDVSGGATASGSPVVLYACDGTPAQVWNLTPGGSGVALVNPASGLCLADPGDATAHGTQAVIATCKAGYPGMSWRPS